MTRTLTCEVVSPQDPTAGLNVTFTVLSGGGRVLGLHNGSPYAAPDGTSATQTYAAHRGLSPITVITLSRILTPIITLTEAW